MPTVADGTEFFFLIAIKPRRSFVRLGDSRKMNLGKNPPLGSQRQVIFYFMDTRRIAEKAQDWKELAQGQAREFKHKARRWQEDATDSVRSGGMAVHEYVHENAWKSIAVASAVALLLGFLLRRSRD